MLQLLIALAIVAAAAVVAEVLRRRQRLDPPTQRSHQLPSQLDRADFESPEVPWLVAVFTSDTCSTCADVVAKAAVLASESVAVTTVSYQRHRSLHDRYRIDAVPGVVVVDREGVAHAAFVGPVTATDLWAAVAEAREPGSRPDPQCDR
ncbi:MAG: hypothetical protein JK586_08840 [Nocardiopsis sp. BM-2018]|nr:MAG: hypothetical protein JK586_08840 [Nocardiopsis sp. BM-2018]